MYSASAMVVGYILKIKKVCTYIFIVKWFVHHIGECRFAQNTVSIDGQSKEGNN